MGEIFFRVQTTLKLKTDVFRSCWWLPARDDGLASTWVAAGVFWLPRPRAIEKDFCHLISKGVLASAATMLRVLLLQPFCRCGWKSHVAVLEAIRGRNFLQCSIDPAAQDRCLQFLLVVSYPRWWPSIHLELLLLTSSGYHAPKKLLGVIEKVDNWTLTSTMFNSMSKWWFDKLQLVCVDSNHCVWWLIYGGIDKKKCSKTPFRLLEVL